MNRTRDHVMHRLPRSVSSFLLPGILIAVLFLGCGKRKHSGSTEDHAKRPRDKYALGTVVFCGRGGQAGRYMQGGWGEIEREMTWTNGYSANLSFTLPHHDRPLRLRMNVAGLIDPPWLPYQAVEVYVNNEKMADWQVTDRADHFAIVPTEVADHVQLLVELRIPTASSPRALKLNEDARVLGIACSEFVIDEATDEAAEAAEQERARLAEEARERVYHLGQVVRMGGTLAQRYKVSGWEPAERDFTWTSRARAVLELKHPPTNHALKLKMQLTGMIDAEKLPFQHTQVFANNQRIAEWQVGMPAEFEAEIPRSALRPDGLLKIELLTPEAISREDLGTGEDRRVLGVRCEAFVISESDSAGSAPSPSPPPKAR